MIQIKGGAPMHVHDYVVPSMLVRKNYLIGAGVVCILAALVCSLRLVRHGFFADTEK